MTQLGRLEEKWETRRGDIGKKDASSSWNSKNNKKVS